MGLNENILIMREKVIQFYKNYERIIIPILKFVVMLYTLLEINSNMGYTEILTKPYVIFGIAIMGMAIPIRWFTPMLVVIVSMHLFTSSMILAFVAMGIFIILYISFIRFYPNESFLIVLTMIAMKLGLGYMIPLAVPIVGGVVCIIPITLGVICYELGIQITTLIQNNMIVGEVQEILELLLNVFQNNVLLNPKTLVTVGIFVAVFMLVVIIRKQSIDYAGYVAIAIGSVINLLGFGLAVLFLEIELSVLILIIMTILSAVIAILIQYLSCVVDYSRAEVVQFEDDDNVYYVKVVPKIQINGNKTKIEQIYTGKSKEDLNHLSNDIY